MLACFQAQFHYSWVPGRRRLYHRKTGLAYVSDRERREDAVRAQRAFERQTERILGVPDVVRWEEERIAPHARRFAHTLLGLFDDLPHDAPTSRNWALLAGLVNDPFTALVLQSDPGPMPHATSRALFMCALTTAPEPEPQPGTRALSRTPSADSLDSYASPGASDSGHESDPESTAGAESEPEPEAEVEREAEDDAEAECRAEGVAEGEDGTALGVPIAVAVDFDDSGSEYASSDDGSDGYGSDGGDGDPLVAHAVWPSTPSLTFSVSPSSPTLGPASPMTPLTPLTPRTPALCLSPPAAHSTLTSTLASPSTAALTLYTSASLTPSLAPLRASFGNLSVVSLADTLSEAQPQPQTEAEPQPKPQTEDKPGRADASRAKGTRHSGATHASGVTAALGVSGAPHLSSSAKYGVKRDSWASWGSGSSADSGLGCAKDLAVTEFRNAVSSVPDYGLLLAALTRVLTLPATGCLPALLPGPGLLRAGVSMPELLAENRSRPRADWPQLEGIWCGLVPSAYSGAHASVSASALEKDLPGYFRLEPCGEAAARECLDLSRLPVPDAGALPNMFFTGQVLDQRLMPRAGARLAGVAAMSADGAVSITFRFMRVSEGDAVRFPDGGLIVRATRVGLESPLGFLGVSRAAHTTHTAHVSDAAELLQDVKRPQTRQRVPLQTRGLCLGLPVPGRGHRLAQRRAASVLGNVES